MMNARDEIAAIRAQAKARARRREQLRLAALCVLALGVVLAAEGLIPAVALAGWWREMIAGLW